MSWRSDSPFELPYGSLICGAHGLVVCEICTVDYSYSFMYDSDELDSSDDSDHGEISQQHLRDLPAAEMGDSFPTGYSDKQIDAEIERRHGEYLAARMRGSPEPGVGDKPVSRGLEGVETKAFPASSSDTPQNLFPVRIARKAFPNVTRFVHRWDRGTFLIYTDGACLNNGQGGAQAGWACVFGPQEEGITTTISGRLENQGPFQEAAEQASNRAELRAVIGALRFRHWVAEGFSKLVIATDSDYVFKGATERMEGWMLRGWKTSKGAAVKNRDLWEAFCGEAERWDDREMEIQFWKIPREMNAKADGLAKNDAEGDDVEEFFDLLDR